MTPQELTRLRAVDTAVHKLLAGQIHQWNEGRVTVSLVLLQAVRKAHRKPGDTTPEAYALRLQKGD